MFYNQEKPLLTAVTLEKVELDELFPECLVHSLISLLADQVPDFNSAALNGQKTLPELLQQVDRVVIATQNSKKCAALTRWFHDYLMVIKGETKIKLNQIDVPGNEPNWTCAAAVAWHKVQAVVEELRSTQYIEDRGGNTLVIGSDIVAHVNGEPFHNLSRIKQEKGKLDGKDLALQLEALKKAYSNVEGSNITYDIAVAVSAKNKIGRKILRAATGVRLELKLAMVPNEVIERVFNGHKPDVFNINTGLPFVDPESELNQYVLGYALAPLSKFVDYSGTEDQQGLTPKLTEFPPDMADVTYFNDVDFSQLNDQEKAKHLDYIRMMVMGGLPPNINNLLAQRFIKINGNPLKMV